MKRPQLSGLAGAVKRERTLGYGSPVDHARQQEPGVSPAAGTTQGLVRRSDGCASQHAVSDDVVNSLGPQVTAVLGLDKRLELAQERARSQGQVIELDSDNGDDGDAEGGPGTGATSNLISNTGAATAATANAVVSDGAECTRPARTAVDRFESEVWPAAFTPVQYDPDLPSGSERERPPVVREVRMALALLLPEGAAVLEEVHLGRSLSVQLLSQLAQAASEVSAADRPHETDAWVLQELLGTRGSGRAWLDVQAHARTIGAAPAPAPAGLLCLQLQLRVGLAASLFTRFAVQDVSYPSCVWAPISVY